MKLDINGTLQQAISAHKEGKYYEAEVFYQKILEVQSTHPDTNHNLGILKVALNKIPEALLLFKTATETNPNIEQFWISFGNTLLNEKRFDEAEICFRKAIELKPNSTEAYNNLGIILENFKKLEEAEKSYKKAIELKPDSFEAYFNLGDVLKKLKRSKEAEIKTRKAIELKPESLEAQVNLGFILHLQGRLNEAEEVYKKIIDTKLDFAEVHNNYGITLHKLGKLDEAVISYNKAIQFKLDYSEAYSNLGNTLRELGKIEESEENYKKAIEFKADNVEAFYNLANLLKDLERFKEAELSYKKAIKFKPDFVEAKYLLAALTGKVTGSPPRVYVENLFDEYAYKFENSLLEKLEYQVPKIITGMIISNNPKSTLGSILDLGCGTGLIGESVKNLYTRLEGIDLSKLMLDQAKNKNIYNKLEHRDIVDYLSTEKLEFDYFISADTFVYIGDLSDIFRLIKYRNNSKGKFIFSTEHTDKDGFILEKTGRYSHSKRYIETLCKKFNYQLSCFEKINLRRDNKKVIKGALYLLDF